MLNNKVSKAVRLAIAFGAASTAAFSASSNAAEEGVEKVERIQVTGSRIKRTDLEGASPVEIISFSDMKDAGRLSVSDALQSLTGNSFGADLPSSGNGAQSQSTINLLGIGAGRTLVLLDGKRLAGSPTLGGSTANLSSIPAAAVERIEILKDGASAIYGSDAIAGVINIILKKDFEGVSFDISYGRPDAEGGDTKTMSFSAGVSSDKGSITFVYDHQEQGFISDSMRDYTAASMEDRNGDGIISIYDDTVGISYYGASIFNPVTGDREASPACDQLTATVPGFVGSLDQGTILGGIGGGEVCGYAYANVSTNSASTNRDAVMTSMDYEILDDVEVYARAMFSKNESYGQYAPAAANWDGIPVGNEHNPYDVEIDGNFRWYGIGPRGTLIEDYQQDYIIGFKGMIADNVEWEVSYHRAKLDYHETGRDYLSYAGLYYNLANDIPLGTEDGQSNMSLTTYRKNQNVFDHIFAGAGFELGELPGGMISHYIGAERYETQYSSQFDSQSEAGLVGGSAGNTSAGSRTNDAYFYEISLPVTDELLLSGAYRYDDYSDVGSKGVPSFKAEYRPTEDLLIRGSYSKGFRAPSLDELLGQDSFSATFATDYPACKAQGIPLNECPEGQFDNIIKSNSNLKPETSTYMNIGVVYSGVEDLSVKLDYFDVEVEDIVANITVQDLMYADFGGVLNQLLDAYPTLSYERNAQGAFSEDIVTTADNGAVSGRTGLDLELTYRLETGFGDFRLRSQTTYLLEVLEDIYFGGPSQDYKGHPGLPKWRSQFELGYSVDNLSVNWVTDAIASTGMVSAPVINSDGSIINESTGDRPTYITHNLTAAYDFGNFGRVTVGARNLFDKGVIYDDVGNWINDTLYIRGHYGREIFGGYSIKF
ncbi:TonB-dependent receptor domain-containing protein [Pseudoalteromonas sp. ZZD1]|uniref:TonB-dependent receptor domain-containing protein n=1 Tax=Pseudoalteromonas sp. ZZD1 TaxID=3139395 RepID=UPI003BAD62CD